MGPDKISSECTEMSFPLQKCLEAVLASTGSGRPAPKGFAGQRSAIPRIQHREHCTPCTGVKGSQWLWVISRFRPGELKIVLTPSTGLNPLLVPGLPLVGPPGLPQGSGWVPSQSGPWAGSEVCGPFPFIGLSFPKRIMKMLDKTSGFKAFSSFSHLVK